MAETNTRQASRAPVTLKIKFKSETLDQFIERYSVDISHGGIFIRTKDPLAVGTSLKFEFQLKDATPLITGEGTVVWTREPDAKRAGVSPGMGVRFDKLPNESQKVLDKVLAQKGGKLKSEVVPMDSDDEDGAGDFVDTPTRVAPAGLVDSLTTNQDYDDGDLTPLPKPMPFHGDAGDFSDEAFNESTKVASLDSILAQAQGSSESEDSAYDEDAVFASTSPPAKKAAKAPAKAMGKSATPATAYEDPFADLDEPGDTERADTQAETKVLRDALERSETALDEDLDKEPAKKAALVDLAESSVEDSPLDDLDDESELDDDDDGVGADRDKADSDKAAASSTQSATARAAVLDPSTEDEHGSSMPWIAVAAVILLIGGAGGFWLLNNGKKGDKTSRPVATTTTPVVTDPPKLPDSAIKDPEKPPEVIEQPAVATKSVAISTVPEGASLVVEGTELSATSPASFDLEEGKAYTILVRHDAFLPASMEVVADGSLIETVKLTAKPKLIRFSSQPSGAIVTVNGQRLRGRTPVDLPVSKRMAAMPSVRVQLRLPGYKVLEGSVDMNAGFESSDTEIVSSFGGKLEDVPRAASNNNSSQESDKPDAGAGSADKPPVDTNPTDLKPDTVKPDTVKPNTGKPDTVKPDTVKPDTVKPDTVKPDTVKPDPQAGNGEPTPDWMK